MFFAITEYQLESQWLFEQTFGLHFSDAFVQLRRTAASAVNLTFAQMERIRALNYLDVELYNYACGLFVQRLHRWQRRNLREQTSVSNGAFVDEESRENDSVPVR